MNKKFLNAILFGALMVTSTGTFVSCKDYDDDIDNLQTQVDGLDSALKELDAKLKEGLWVTSVTPVEGGFTISFSNNETYTIVSGKDGAPGQAGKDGNSVEVKNGKWWINGEETDFIAVKKEDLGNKTMMPEIKDGYWCFWNEETQQLEPSEYKAAGAAYAVLADGKYTLYMPDENGEMLPPFELPTAASMINSLDFVTTPELKIYSTTWTFKAGTSGIANAGQWAGTKTLPADNSKVYGATDPLFIQVNPAELDVVKEEIDFSLINGKNELALANLALTAESFAGNVKPDGTPITKAAANNGLFNIYVNPQVITEKVAEEVDEALTAANGSEIGYALNAADAYRSAYRIAVNKEATAPKLTKFTINSTDVTLEATKKQIKNIQVGKEYEVTFTDEAALYDAYFTVKAADKDEFDIVINKEEKTFVVNRNPDYSTTDVHFPLTVYTADINGAIKKTVVEIHLSSIISDVQTLDAQVVNVATQDKFSFAMSDVNVSGNNTWVNAVNLNGMKYALYKDAKLTQEVSGVVAAGNLFTPAILDANNGATTEIEKAKTVQFTINNDKASAAGMKLDTQYFVKVTFNDKANKPLNSVVLPVTFVAPALSELYAIKEGYQAADGTINAYFTVEGKKNITIAEYFLKSAAGATLNLDGDTKIGSTNKKSSELANITSNTILTLNELVKKPTPNAQFELGYGEALIVEATKNDFAGWTYVDNADKLYTFKIRVMSPIVEGKVMGAAGKPIPIKANDAMKGADITVDMIKGYDYNNNEYNVVPDKYDATQAAWNNPQIKKVEATTDTGTNYLKDVKVVPATQVNGKTVAGSIKVYANSLTNTTTVKMPVKVTDAWGYVLEEKVDVTITVGE